MSRLVLVVTAVLAAVVLATAPAAPAAVSLGAVATAEPPATCAAGESTVFGGGVPFTIPPAGGVLTGLRTAFAGSAGTAFEFRVFRPTGIGWVGVATVPATVGADGAATVATRVPVQAGDLLGLSKPAGGSLNCAIPAAGAIMFGGTGPAIADGQFFTLTVSPNLVPNVAATLEPDADRDHFGDETQDRCPTDPIHTTDACLADVGVTLELAERHDRLELDAGAEGVVIAKIENSSMSPSENVKVTVGLGKRLRASYAEASAGTCEVAPPVSCNLGTLPSKTRVTVFLVVRGLRAGPATVQMRANGATSDPALENNNETIDVDVGAARVARECRVPSLKGAPAVLAARLLGGRGCRLGRVSRPRRARGRLVVVRQSVKAGSLRPLDTKVSVTLGPARR